MTFRPVDVYELLEPMLRDYGKLRMRNMCEFCTYRFESFTQSYSRILIDFHGRICLLPLDNGEGVRHNSTSTS
jgi:hypothetical protein